MNKNNKKIFAGFLPSSFRRFGQFYGQSRWTAHSGEAFTHRVCPGDRNGPRQSHRTGGGQVVTHPRLQGTVFTVPGGYMVCIGSLITMGRTGRLQVEVPLSRLTFPPPQDSERKRKENNKTRQEATAHAGTQRPPPTGRLRGAFRESSPRPGWASRTALSSTYVAAIQTRGLVGESRMQSNS